MAEGRKRSSKKEDEFGRAKKYGFPKIGNFGTGTFNYPSPFTESYEYTVNSIYLRRLWQVF